MIKTNELKKGTRVLLSNGWYATLQDNKKGNIRLAEVEGLYTETGDIYSHDIRSALINGQWVNINHTPAQKSLKHTVDSLFG